MPKETSGDNVAVPVQLGQTCTVSAMVTPGAEMRKERHDPSSCPSWGMVRIAHPRRISNDNKTTMVPAEAGIDRSLRRIALRPGKRRSPRGRLYIYTNFQEVICGGQNRSNQAPETSGADRGKLRHPVADGKGRSLPCQEETGQGLGGVDSLRGGGMDQEPGEAIGGKLYE